MAPWAYIASVIYHDLYWYPRFSKDKMKECLFSDWGRLFQNWDQVSTLPPATPEGFPEVGISSPKFHRDVMAMLKQSMKVLGTCITEAPEVAAHRKHKQPAGK
jgi:hypothetical protein